MSAADFAGYERASTGIEGLDSVLGGGLPRDRMYLIEGAPGAGKTTLALQFLLAGARYGEPGVYATMSESELELNEVSRSHGWQLDGISFCALQSAQESLRAESQYTLFHPSEIELSETTRAVLDTIERVHPARLVLDSLSEMRLLARDPLLYRRQILSFKRYCTGRRCTVLLLDDTAGTSDFHLQTLTHGIISLENLDQEEYGGQRRRLRIKKLRGVAFRDGYHDYSIRTGGLAVQPRLVAANHRRTQVLELVGSGLPELDALLGGGIERGTGTLLLGPSGVGKSTLAMQYVFAAAARGERSVVYLFDELPAVWTARGAGLGMDFAPLLACGDVELRYVDPAELSPGELSERVRRAVESGTRLVVIDSLNGYQSSMPGERFLGMHLRELLSFLNEHGVLTLMVLTQHGLVGSVVEAPIELSYLADNVILLRYFEAFGEIRQAISVIKRRAGSHGRSIRELRLDRGGVRVGRELRDFQGVLGGNLTYVGDRHPLLTERKSAGRKSRSHAAG
ncbi:MAG TPA: ATPase domain-containing protein [Thermoanaerobaculia bacterium]|nr:ATPase domain-containing protein [Thermoanaerobaculia bacterium]